MAVELRDLVVDIAVHAAAVADSALSSLYDLFSAGMPRDVDPGAVVVGGGAGGVVGGGAVNGGGGGGGGDRGFRFTGTGDNTIRDSPSSDGTVVGVVPNGSRLVYDRVVRNSSGDPTHYHVTPPGGTPGWIPAGSTSNTRPNVPPPPRPSVVIDSGSGLANSSSAQTAGSRG